MREVPPDQRTAPASIEEIAEGTLQALRDAAIGHGQTAAADSFDKELQRREKRQIRR